QTPMAKFCVIEGQDCVGAGVLARPSRAKLGRILPSHRAPERFAAELALGRAGEDILRRCSVQALPLLKTISSARLPAPGSACSPTPKRGRDCGRLPAAHRCTTSVFRWAI